MSRWLSRKFIRILSLLCDRLVLLWFRVTGPPRILNFSMRLNAEILRSHGAEIGRNKVRILPPITLHEAENHYGNLSIADGCIINGNNFFDLSAKIVLEEGVSIGPGVMILTHNRFNYNEFLEEKLVHMCGKKGVIVKKGAGIKAGALITMGVVIGENAVISGNAVVNRDVLANTFVAGVPAKVVRRI